jgi:hypothetical protein
MARQNLLRSLLAASLMATTVAVGLSALTPAPAGAADATLYRITLSEKSGFDPGVQDQVRVGDYIAFFLDMKSSTSTDHSVTWDDQSTCPDAPGAGPCWPELRFNDPNQKCMVRNYVLPNTRCVLVRTAGPFRYHDALYQAAGGQDFQGLINVAGPTTTTTTTAAPTTTTTTAPTTTTSRPVTTTTLPSTTTTTAAPTTTIRPFLIQDPDPTTTTTARPATSGAAGANKSGLATPAGKGKSKGKGDAPATPTTATPAPPDAPSAEPVFDPASLTPGPITLPETVVSADPEDGAYLDSALMGLLNPEKTPDDGTGLMLAVLAVTGFGVLAGGAWLWYHRGSRYFPA